MLILIQHLLPSNQKKTIFFQISAIFLHFAIDQVSGFWYINITICGNADAGMVELVDTLA